MVRLLQVQFVIAKYPNHKIVGVLKWIAEGQIVSFSHVQRLLGRTLTANGSKEKALSKRTTNYHITRWVEMGLAERKRIDDMTYIYLTVKGYEYVSCSLTRTFPIFKELTHQQTINEVRLYVESRRGLGIKWIPERSPDCIHGEFRVDANVIVEGQYVAVEVELTVKSKDRLRRILQDRVDTFPTTWYFVKDSVTPIVRLIIEEMPTVQERLVIIDLSSL